MNACKRNCWIAAAVAGVAVAAFLLMVSHMALAAALFLGLVTSGLLGALLVWGFCARASGSEATPAEARSPMPAVRVAPVTPVAPVAPPPAAEPVAEPAPVAATSQPAAPASAAHVAAKPAADEAARAAMRKARRQAKAKAATPAAAGEAPAKPKPSKAEREARAARRAARQAQAAPHTDGEPELLPAPRGGKADDLKAIKGVGPKFEKLLNANGIWHYDQIASWGPKDIATLDAKLEGFSGRIERAGWVEQAKTLAAGGATAFSRRVAKGDVYKDGE